MRYCSSRGSARRSDGDGGVDADKACLEVDIAD